MMRMSVFTNPSRRNFLRSAGAIAGAAALSARSYANVAGANSRLNMAFIGCGGMASHHLGQLLRIREEENLGIVAMCDVYKTRAEQFRDKCKAAGAEEPIVTQDYRDILAMSDIDYVLIATPEHSHAYLTLAALDAGKHVYCEKPMTHDIDESLAVVEKANKTGLKLQVGVQGMADDSYSSAYEAIKAGKLGQVVEAQIDYVRRYSLDKGPWRGDTKDDTPQPPDLDWETWVTPRRKRPWNPHHYFEWRNYRDYSGGVATDLFVHRITRLIKALGLTFPTRAVGMGGIYVWPDGRDLPDNFEMLLEYPGQEPFSKGLTMRVLGTMANERGDQHCIRGHEATLVFTSEGWDIISQDSGKVIESHAKTGGEDVVPHHKNHHAAIRDGVDLYCPPELGLYSVVAVRMGNLSWFKRKMVGWNPKRLKVVPS
ncbi:MAG: Gfo/Idh/MocA family oxidoreductase [Candidatus Hydrogenedentes bacterium]|nr:Gfo/Idh/MocA family oxidoreductase [Candidatus Hydrogenedentota bacterium]